MIMRLFAALDISEDIRKKAAGLIRQFDIVGFDINFVKPANLHFTLKFLGEVDEARMPEIRERIGECVKNIKRFEIDVEGVGFFGSEKFIRTIWIGMSVGKEEAIRLIESLNRGLDYIRKDEFKPSPHLTIARVVSGRNREQLLDLIKMFEGTKLGKMLVKEIKLKKSILKPGGPEYSDVASFRLE